MTTIRDFNVVHGSVFGLPHLLSLDDDDCNVLLVSSRTLSIIQALGNNEVAFTARYAAQFLDGNRYVLADSSTDLDDINDIVNLYRLEVTDLSCDIVAALQEIAVQISSVAQVGCGQCGSEIDPASASTPAVGPGEPWADWPTYDVYKCRGANWLMDGLIDFFQKMLVYDVDFWTSATVSAGTGLISSIILTTVLGGWVLLVAGAAISLITALIIGTTIDLGDIKNVLVAARDDLICTLYNGSDAEGSKTAFLAQLSAEGLNAAETGLIGLILQYSLVNQIYEWNEEINTWTITTECTECGGDPCPFYFVKGSGTPTYDGSEFVLTSEDMGSYHAISFSSLYSDTGCTGGNWCVEFTATTIKQPDGTWQRALWCWDSPVTLQMSQYKPNFPPLDTPLTIMALEMSASTGPFTITAKVTGKNGLCIANPAEGCS